MRQETVTIAVIVYLLAVVPSARGATTFWLSEDELPPGSTVPDGGEAPALNKVVGSLNQQLQLWVQPDDGETLENFSLNLVSTDADVLAFTAVQVHNTIDENTARFQFTFDTTKGLNPDPLLQTACPFEFDAPLEMALWGFKGFSVEEGTVGIGPIGRDSDPRYDAVNQSWLLATVTYDVLQEGATDLYLQVGEVGMNLAGGSAAELSVVFGDREDTPLNARDDHCVESSRADASITAVPKLLGDFNGNGFLDAGDMDLLSAIVRGASHLNSFDLTNDNLVDGSDRVRWVTELAGTFFGDADLSGAVEFADFLFLSANFGAAGGWADGEFNGDGLVNFGDFLLLSDSFGRAAAARPVPEPGASGKWLAIVMALLVSRRRCRSRCA